tara:strand:+ start:62 stop:1168 length:1107 start_codon:yes stop_codon:yes gene_type:complete
MSNILTEISRVREIMGVLSEQTENPLSGTTTGTTDTIQTPSEEISTWAEEQIESRQQLIDRGPISDSENSINDISEEDIETWRNDVIALKKDPVKFVKKETGWYCEKAETDSYYGDDCEEMTELLETQGTLSVTTTGTTTGTTNNDKVEAYIEIKGCTDPKYKEYKKKYTKDDGSCKTLKNKYKEKDPTVNQLGKDLKTAWKTEVFAILDGIQTGDIFGFGEVYSLQKTDKLHALLKMLQNLMCVNAKIAKTVILAEDNVYDSGKLMRTAIMPVGGGHEGLIDTIENNMDRLDKKFKLFRGGMKVDKKLRPIRKQLDRARDFIKTIDPYLNWSQAEDTLGFKARSTEDIFLNSKNLNQLHIECASQIK